ncbi:hypothetical protein [Pseudomonas lactucae]|uniref:hypothetical protein n=1 Tax=Pseudomonas lactucae TaxID=2813360 RepID=UPI002FCCD488
MNVSVLLRLAVMKIRRAVHSPSYQGLEQVALAQRVQSAAAAPARVSVRRAVRFLSVQLKGVLLNAALLALGDCIVLLQGRVLEVAQCRIDSAKHKSFLLISMEKSFTCQSEAGPTYSGAGRAIYKQPVAKRDGYASILLEHHRCGR